MQWKIVLFEDLDITLKIFPMLFPLHTPIKETKSSFQGKLILTKTICL